MTAAGQDAGEPATSAGRTAIDVAADLVMTHRRLVLLAWLVATTAGVLLINTTNARLTTEFSVSGQAAYATDARIFASYGDGGSQPPTLVVVTAPAGASVTSAAGLAVTTRAFTAAGAVYPDLRVADYANSAFKGFITADRRSAFAVVQTPPSGDPAPVDLSPGIQAAAAAALPPGWMARVTGLSELENAANSNESGVLADTILGAAAALLVLLLVFRTGLAVVPIIMAAATIPVIFLATLAVTAVTGVSFVVEYLISLIGLGVAIDYSLLIITRWRDARLAGDDQLAAIHTALRTGGRACVSSGITVAISLLALVIFPAPFLRSIGIAGFLIPVVSVLSAVTLLPVLLFYLGGWLDHPSRFRRSGESVLWQRWGHLLFGYKIPIAVFGVLIMGALLVPVWWLQVGEPLTGSLAKSGQSYDALTTLRDGGVPAGLVNPIEVLVTRSATAPVAARLRGLDGVFGVVAPDTAQDRLARTAVIDVLPYGESSAAAGAATVSRVQAALDGVPGVLGVGGPGAEQAAFNSAIYGLFPLFIILVGALTFVVLVRTFRSVGLAAKAVIVNLASVSCAYGIVVLVWLRGWGSRQIWGIPPVGAIPQWAPIAIFAFLFGLSMDYEVFILSRMREEYDASGSTRQAVINGIGATGRLVTSGAIILFCAIAALSRIPLTSVKILATGVGAGILLDAFLVRSLLVPALVGAFGEWNWWLPRLLQKMLWLPDQPGHIAQTGPPAPQQPPARRTDQ
jgi:RND superfamily putative drug exporter